MKPEVIFQTGTALETSVFINFYKLETGSAQKTSDFEAILRNFVLSKLNKQGFHSFFSTKKAHTFHNDQGHSLTIGGETFNLNSGSKFISSIESPQAEIGEAQRSKFLRLN